MTSPFSPCVGAVFSADIAVPEHEREVRFYARVLSTGDDPLWSEADLSNNLGMPIIGLGERLPEYESLPLQWMPHIQVADVAASVSRAEDLGGTVLLHQQDDEGTSLWAVLLDPGGTAFGLIPVIPAETLPLPEDELSGARPFGRIAWLDLTVPSADDVRDFYREVVGWGVEPVEMDDAEGRYHDYNMLGGDDRPAAGICHARGPNAALPAVWMIYLPVGDLEESLRHVEAEGGTILTTMKDAQGNVAYAAVRDPVGAHFALAAA